MIKNNFKQILNDRDITLLDFLTGVRRYYSNVDTETLDMISNLYENKNTNINFNFEVLNIITDSLHISLDQLFTQSETTLFEALIVPEFVSVSQNKDEIYIDSLVGNMAIEPATAMRKAVNNHQHPIPGYQVTIPFQNANQIIIKRPNVKKRAPHYKNKTITIKLMQTNEIDWIKGDWNGHHNDLDVHNDYCKVLNEWKSQLKEKLRAFLQTDTTIQTSGIDKQIQ